MFGLPVALPSSLSGASTARRQGATSRGRRTPPGAARRSGPRRAAPPRGSRRRTGRRSPWRGSGAALEVVGLGLACAPRAPRRGAASSFASALRSSSLPWRRVSASPVRSPTACLALPADLVGDSHAPGLPGGQAAKRPAVTPRTSSTVIASSPASGALGVRVAAPAAVQHDVLRAVRRRPPLRRRRRAEQHDGRRAEARWPGGRCRCRRRARGRRAATSAGEPEQVGPAGEHRAPAAARRRRATASASVALGRGAGDDDPPARPRARRAATAAQRSARPAPRRGSRRPGGRSSTAARRPAPARRRGQVEPRGSAGMPRLVEQPAPARAPRARRRATPARRRVPRVRRTRSAAAGAAASSARWLSGRGRAG